eukprot:161729-Prymnesium_polylepis.1
MIAHQTTRMMSSGAPRPSSREVTGTAKLPHSVRPPRAGQRADRRRHDDTDSESDSGAALTRRVPAQVVVRAAPVWRVCVAGRPTPVSRGPTDSLLSTHLCHGSRATAHVPRLTCHGS